VVLAYPPVSAANRFHRMVELQAFLVELIDKFNFAPTEDMARVRRASGFVMIPALEGEKQKGSQLPLLISSASA
jgi:hypothetical protein